MDENSPSSNKIMIASPVADDANTETSILAVIGPELRSRANSLQKRVDKLQRDTLKDSHTAGRELIFWKRVLPHGAFQPFIEVFLGLQIRTAQIWMRMAEVFPDYQSIEHLRPSVVYALASVASDVLRKDLLAKITATQMTAAKVNALIQAARTSPSSSTPAKPKDKADDAADPVGVARAAPLANLFARLSAHFDAETLVNLFKPLKGYAFDDGLAWLDMNAADLSPPVSPQRQPKSKPAKSTLPPSEQQPC